MKATRRSWTRDELLLAINLYCKLPFGKLHQRNPEIIHLAGILGRTPGSVAFKLVNFASLDPSLQRRGIRGAAKCSRLDREVWNEFYNNWDTQVFESEVLLAKMENTSIEKNHPIIFPELPLKGEEREQIIRARVNQSFFRRAVLASYNYTCCITGICYPDMLVAGHIRPWSTDEGNRMNPRNGLALNALHDRAFELGYITILPDYKIKVSTSLKKEDAVNLNYFWKYDGQKIQMPARFLPDRELLRYHNEERFRR